MQEELITFPTAILAKEKGFSGNTNTITPYCFNSKEESSLRSCNNTEEGYYCRPTQTLLQRWLREEYGIDVEIRKHFKVYNIMRICWYNKFTDTNVDISLGGLEWKNFLSYEEALEVGLLKALKLIP